MGGALTPLHLPASRPGRNRFTFYIRLFQAGVRIPAHKKKKIEEKRKNRKNISSKTVQTGTETQKASYSTGTVVHSWD
jgi:hypothetical protein